MAVQVRYKTTATASGAGREGKTVLADGTMSLDLVRPKELGGPGGDGANPEKLFALGYSACFLSALRVGSAQTKIKLPEDSTVTATIGIGPRSEGGFGITAELDVFLPNLPQADAHKARRGHARDLPILECHQGQRRCEDDNAVLGGARPKAADFLVPPKALGIVGARGGPGSMKRPWKWAISKEIRGL